MNSLHYEHIYRRSKQIITSMKNILILISVIITSVLMHQQYAMEAEKISSNAVAPLKAIALEAFLTYADFDNINKEDLSKLKFLNDLPQAPEIAEHLGNKYLNYGVKDITLSLGKCYISSCSYNDKILLVKRWHTIDQYVLNSKHNRFDYQTTLKAKIEYAKLTQFGSKNYILWNCSQYQENNTLTSLEDCSHKSIVGIAKNGNNNNIFIAADTGQELSIAQESLANDKQFKIISRTSFKQPIDFYTIVVAKNGNIVVVEDRSTRKKSILNLKTGTFSSLAHFINFDDKVLDVYGKYILVRTWDTSDKRIVLHLWRKTSNKQKIIFSRKYPVDTQFLAASLIENNKNIIGVLTHQIIFDKRTIVASLFQYSKPTDTLFLAHLLKHPITIDTPIPFWHKYDNLD